MRIPERVGSGFRIMVAVSCVAVASCDSQGPGIAFLEELSRSRARWSSVGPSDYTYAVERHCFCGFAVTPVRVTVSDGVVTERRFVESGELIPAEIDVLFPSVDGLFEVLFDAVERDAYSIKATFDPDTGVPLVIAIDYEFNVSDEELGFLVTEVPSS